MCTDAGGNITAGGPQGVTQDPESGSSAGQERDTSSVQYSSCARGGRGEERRAEVAQELHAVHHCMLGSH